MTEHPLAYFFNAATLTIIGFSLHLLVLRARRQPFYWPLAGCLLAISVLISQPWLRDQPLVLRQLLLLAALPALYVLPPCFWLYVQGLTSSTPWQWQRRHLRHLAAAGLALFIAICGALLPAEIRYGLLVEGSEQVLASATPLLRYFVYSLVIMTFVLILAWCVYAGYYLFAVSRQLHRYRAALRQIFASTERQELRWIAGLLAVVTVIWLLAALSLLYDNLVGPLRVDPALKHGAILLLVWYLASWGLRQKPGFAGLDQTDNETAAVLAGLNNVINTSSAVASSDSIARHVPEQQASAPQASEQQRTAAHTGDAKYQRSALHTELASSIAAKLQLAMQQDQLFLDASLSLPKLAKHIATSPAYLSQTLNETLGMNFFDFVNRYRVAAAKQQLTSTAATALEVAMNVGFNAKSSFYTAFKKETGLTPQQYRQQQRQSACPPVNSGR